MKEIALSKDMVALVDDEDYERLSAVNWHAERAPGERTWYAYRRTIVDGRSLRISMHAEVKPTPDGMMLDHKDHNGLNNQKSNLRPCTYIQNRMNSRPHLGKKYKGTHKNKRRFGAQICINEKRTYIGNYGTEEEAARAYDKVAFALYGEFAYLNFPLEVVAK